MKKYFPNLLIALAMIALVFTYVMGIPNAVLSQEGTPQEIKANDSATSAGMVKNIMLGKFPGKERVHLVVSKQPVIDVKRKDDGSYLVKLEDFDVEESLCRPLGEGELTNIISVVPSKQFINGKNWVYLTIYPHEIVPYAVRQEGENVLIDFNITSLEARSERTDKSSATKKTIAKVSSRQNNNDVDVKPVNGKNFKDRIVSLDFQDADIKSVFRLMAEYGNISIITTDEVKGNITLSMKNVPWTKALETILEIQSLTKKEEGNIIIITTMERSKKDEAAREEINKKEKIRRAENGMLKQIIIEAKIVEATEDFARNLGIQWGFGNQQRVSGSSKYGLGVAGSNLAKGKSYQQSYPSQIGVTDAAGDTLAMAAVNLPAALGQPAIGLVFGGATGFLEAQIAALETNTAGKVISSPKIVTMEGIKAVIKQGEEVPYKTRAANGEINVQFKEALLKLEVTPQITAEGKISMDIIASNDYPDWTKTNVDNENPPIVKNEVQSKLVINDGDTIVIGGVLKSTNTITTGGWPWLQKIPVLGWLFKAEDKKKNKRELLIFVTPKILTSADTIESPESLTNK